MMYLFEAGVGWKEVDPWDLLGAEAMVAWDRDVAPLLEPGIKKFELEYTEHGALVRMRGMVMRPEVTYSAQALWRSTEGRWESTMLGWRPWWMKYFSQSTPG